MGPLVAFFSLTYIISWTAFFLARPGSPLFLIGVFAPSLVALALTAYAEGTAGTLTPVGRIGRWPAGARWVVFALGYMAAVKLAAAVLHRLLTGVWPPFGDTPLYLMAAAIAVSTPVQAGEEIGWRGYALPRLAKHLGLARASIVVGVMWACWHIPLFLKSGTDTSGQSFPIYLVSVTALSVAMAWLFWRTDGNLLLVMMMHAAVNNTKDIVPSAGSVGPTPFHLNASLVAWLTAALLWIAAAWFLVHMRRVSLHPGGQALRHAALTMKQESFSGVSGCALIERRVRIHREPHEWVHPGRVGAVHSGETGILLDKLENRPGLLWFFWMRGSSMRVEGKSLPWRIVMAWLRRMRRGFNARFSKAPAAVSR